MTTERLGESPVVIVKEGFIGIVETKFFAFSEPLNEFELENGTKLGPIRVAYETYGKLNKSRDNVILIEHALTASANAAGKHSDKDKSVGWWDAWIGPGKAFDTNKYYVVCSNILGSCYGTTGPSSINPDTNKPYGYTFPIITIKDMVNVQKKLLDHLEILNIHCIAGGSMGGMQAIEWALLYPDFVNSLILIASGAWSNPQSIAIHKVGIQSIMDDPNFNGGDYYGKQSPDKGLAIARMIGHITYLNNKVLWQKFGRKSEDMSKMISSFENKFHIEKYLEHQGKKFVKRFDANCYIYIMRAIDLYDASQGYPNLKKSFKRLEINKALITSFTSDWLFPSYQSKELVGAMRENDIDVTYEEIQSDYGHDSFLLEYKKLTPLIKTHLIKK